MELSLVVNPGPVIELISNAIPPQKPITVDPILAEED